MTILDLTLLMAALGAIAGATLAISRQLTTIGVDVAAMRREVEDRAPGRTP